MPAPGALEAPQVPQKTAPSVNCAPHLEQNAIAFLLSLVEPAAETGRVLLPRSFKLTSARNTELMLFLSRTQFLKLDE